MSNLSHDVRRFNRFELKYLVPLREAEAFKQALRAYLLPDGHGDAQGCYRLASLYYDGPDLRCYWEKVDGIRWRRKLRIRYYGAGLPPAEDTLVYVEIKQRLNRVTQKRRVLLPYAQALRLCDERYIPEHAPQDHAVIKEMLGMLVQYDLRATSLVQYARQAFVGTEYDLGLRVTFDTDLAYRSGDSRLEGGEGLALFPPDRAIIEIKANERIPYWLTELVAQHDLGLVRMSKYCRSIELAYHLPAAVGRLAVR